MQPVFLCNSSATTIECLVGIRANYRSAAGTLFERVNPPTNLYPSNGSRGMRYFEGQSIGGGGGGDDDFQNLTYQPTLGLTGDFTIGYAITADSGDEASYQITQPTQADYRAFATLPRAIESTGNTAPLISRQVISFTFPMPSRRSTIFFGYKSSGGFAGALPIGRFTGSTTIYYDTYSSPDYWVQEVGGFVTTWYLPGVSISASGGASVGKTSRLTITAPVSLRTLTSSDFTVSGGTISNFTRVS